MCTVVYYPLADGIILSSNRDELMSRGKAHSPEIISLTHQDCLMPVDSAAGGTWAGITSSGQAFVLFNGAFQNHVRLSSYRSSRGLVMKLLASYDDMHVAWNAIDLFQIEPFSIILFQRQELFRLVWDGNSKHTQLLPTHRPQIWSSATLYSAEAQLKRQQVFDQFCATYSPGLTTNELLQFLQESMPDDNHDRFVMNRGNNLGTLSITVLCLNNINGSCEYHDLLSKTSFYSSIPVLQGQNQQMNEATKQDCEMVA